MKRVLSLLVVFVMMLCGVHSMAAQTTRPVSLTWTASTSSSVTGYNIYACSVPSGGTTCTVSTSSTPLNGTSTISGTAFTVQEPTGVAYVYGVQAVAPACTSTTPLTTPCGNSALGLTTTVPVPPATAGAGTIVVVVP